MNQIEQTIEKWRHLQKLIKEEVTLSKIISEDKKNQENQFLDWYYDYYQLIIQTDAHLPSTQFSLSRNADILLGDAYNPINELLMRLRQDDDVLIMIIDIIEKNNYIRKDSCNEFVKFLCFQVYEDLFVSNNDDVVLSLIHKLIKREISKTITLKPSLFLDDTSSFLGKFLKYYSSKENSKHLVSLILDEVLVKMKEKKASFELNTSRLNDEWLMEVKKTQSQDSRMSSVSYSSTRISITHDFDPSLLTKGIKKSTFGNKTPPGQSKEVTYSMGDQLFFQNKTNNNKILFNTIAQVELFAKKSTYDNDDNKEYNIPLSENELIKRSIDESTPEELRPLYTLHIGQGNDYTNNKLLSQLCMYPASCQSLLLLYKHNFNNVKECIDIILNNLLLHINSIPYSIRCICRMISDEITAKFPNISKFERNAYIGEFFFKKFLMTYILTNQNGIRTPKLLEKFTSISKILQKISSYAFFSGELEWNYTLLNHYIIEISLNLNQFFDQLINVSIDLPITQPKKIFMIFNVNVILFLNGILKENKAPFESLPNGKFFTKTIKRIANEEEKLKLVMTTEDKRLLYFAIHNSPTIQSNTDAIIQLNETPSNTTSNQVAQVKFCIKCILRDLTVLNNHIYSHLNFANNNRNFFMALNDIINLKHYDNDTDKNDKKSKKKTIPLKWYAMYMMSNLRNDNDDYESLYNELLSEEKVKLNMLEEEYNKNAIEMGMISQCVHNKIDKRKRILVQKNKSTMINLANKIIANVTLFVCIRRLDNIQKGNDSRKTRTNDEIDYGRSSVSTNILRFEQTSKGNKITINSPSSYIQLSKKTQCIHNKLKFITSMVDSKKQDSHSKNKTMDYYHCQTVKQFAKSLSYCNEVMEDINNGNQDHNVFGTIEEYIKLLEENLLTDDIPNKKGNNNTTNNNSNKKRVLKIRNSSIVLTLENKKFFFDYIQEYIMKKIHKEIFPQLIIEIDQTICDKLNSLSYLTKSDFGIKENLINDTLIQLAINGLTNLDNITTPRGKLKTLDSSFTIINNSIQFTLGSDDFTLVEPLIKYILLKAKPARLFSNIYFIRAMSNFSELTGEYGLILYQIESAAWFFINYGEDDHSNDFTNQ